MLGQAWALVLLKLRLTRSMWTGAHTASLLFTLLTLVAMGVLAVVTTVVLFFVGWKVLPELKETRLVLGVLDAVVLIYCAFWASGLLMELQRSDLIDLRRLLYLPVSPRMVVVLNFVASLVGPSLLFYVPGVLALLTGLALHRGPGVFVWGLPLAGAYFLMLAAVTFYARGWLALLMENKRRRRLILTLLPLVFVFLSQLPGLITAAMQNASPDPATQALLEAMDWQHLLVWLNQLLPPAWLAYGTFAALQGQVMHAVLATGGCCVVALVALWLAYGATLRLHRGQRGEKARRGPARKPARPLTARRFPLLDNDTAALAAASFLSFLRHPNIRMLLIMPLFMGFMILLLYRTGAYGNTHREAGGSVWAPVAILVWPFFNFSYVLFNVFGIERDSFRALVLLPNARYKYLLAKNLALFPFVGGLSIAFVLAGAAFLQLPAYLTTVAALQVVQLFLLYTIIGNFVSIYLPHQIGWNGARSTSSRLLMMCVGILSAMLLGVLMLPTAFCLYVDAFARGRFGYEGMPLGLPVSLGILAVTLGVYHVSLRYSGDLLVAREQRVLERLVRDRE